MRRSVVKDLRQGMAGAELAVREFLHQYLTLSRCDLFFADKAILIEGTSERLLLPSMIRKTDEAAAGQPHPTRQYLTEMAAIGREQGRERGGQCGLIQVCAVSFKKK